LSGIAFSLPSLWVQQFINLAQYIAQVRWFRGLHAALNVNVVRESRDFRVMRSVVAAEDPCPISTLIVILVVGPYDLVDSVHFKDFLERKE